MTSIQSRLISVSLGEDAHRWAEQFAAEQHTPQKGKQVYLNTLAVYAVNSYLKWLMVETDLSGGDSWYPGLRALFDVADLVLLKVGKLECRPVLPGEDSFEIPTEVTQDRIGYVAVQFNQQLDSVQLLGFAPAITNDEPPPKLQLTQLQSLDTLIDTIHGISSEHENLGEVLLVNLRQWLEGIFNEDWQPTGLVLASNFRITSITNGLSRAKVINLAGEPLLLVVELTSIAREVVDIRLRLYPGREVIYLPENLQLIVFDEAGIVCMEAQARSADNWMELDFSCQPGERFSVKVVLERTSLTEQFAV